MLAFVTDRWFLIALVAILLAGMAWPAAMSPLARWLPSDMNLAVVTFLMALPLATGALWRAVRRPGPAWLAAAINSGLAPPIGWIASWVLSAELGVGLILATTVPCTLASAAVWTRRAGGNDAVAFLVTMITNLACFIVIPAWLMLLVGIRAEVDLRDIGRSLILLVALPIVLAQILRQVPAIGRWSTRHKIVLSAAAQVGILLMVFVGAVECGRRLSAADGAAITAADIAILISAVIGVHIALLIIGFGLAWAFGIAREDTIAVAFAGSQKTLMVGAYLASAVSPLAILPMVAYHATQLVIDTLVADWLRNHSA